MLILKNLNLHFGDQTIFDELDATLAYDEKIGLLGRNGAGKSTLLRAIAGQQQLDGGTISYDKKKTIGYLPQQVVLNSSKSVFDETFTVFDEFTTLQSEQQMLEEQLAQELAAHEATALSDRYTQVLESLHSFDTVEADVRTKTILQGLGFTAESIRQSVSTLSVGWQMRVVLAKLLLQRADFYLFDEPTNHLDLQTRKWFLQFLQDADFGYLLVTHDRHFLQKGCTNIIELERGKARRYRGSFSIYCTQKQQEQERLRAAQAQQEKEIARKKATIERFRYKATKRGMVQSMEKQLAKIEPIELDPPLPSVNFSFAPVKRSGKVALELKNLSHSFGHKKLFAPSSLQVMRGQKVALVAPNGAGKTTLFNLIVGKRALQQGTITMGHNVESAYFEQEQARVLQPDNTVLGEVLDACPGVAENKIRSFLGSFLFTGDDVTKKIHQLSGGERNRVAMVKILLQNANFLLLDEPTNHLDLYAKEVLLQALQQYEGTMVLVSHDHDFIQDVADTIVELAPEGLRMYPGNYESYLYHKDLEQGCAQTQQTARRARQPEAPDKATARQHKKNLHALERRITKLEGQRDAAGLKLVDCQYDSAEYALVTKRLQQVQHELDDAMGQWERLVDGSE